jgi:GNAT superfamily N-acetyltransferase
VEDADLRVSLLFHTGASIPGDHPLLEGGGDTAPRGDDPATLAFAEDARAMVGIGPDEERVDLGTAVLTLSTGPHYWSSGVARVRFGEDVAGELTRIRDELRARGREASGWTVGESATPPDVLPRLLDLGLTSEPGDGSRIMLLTEPPRSRPTAFRVVQVSTPEELQAAIDVGRGALEQPAAVAAGDPERARRLLHDERTGGHTARLLAFEGDLPISTGQAWVGPVGLYLGGGATIASHRRRGAMSSLLSTAWEMAVRRGTPALVAYGNAMSAPALEGLGFRDVGHVRHLIDRFA